MVLQTVNLGQICLFQAGTAEVGANVPARNAHGDACVGRAVLARAFQRALHEALIVCEPFGARQHGRHLIDALLRMAALACGRQRRLSTLSPGPDIWISHRQ